MDERKYLYDTNYIDEANFTRLKKGADLPLLETEINDIQVIQEKARTSLIKRLMPSGFIELTQKEFSGTPIVYNPIGSNSLILQNHIAIAPSRVMVNGYELNIEGNFSYNGIDNYILVDLGVAPLTGNREDLIYLEVWPQIITGDAPVKTWGYQDGTNLNYSIVDPRVNSETSRRIMFYWNIRVATDINYDKFPDGMGFINSGTFSNVSATTDGSAYNPNDQTTYIFANAASDLFKTCDFYKDHNLYVAGRSDYTLTSQTVYGSYVFALPLFKVKRRNQESYSINNPNGSIKSTDIVSINSSLRSDLNSNIRPDHLYYDTISERDLTELRRTVNSKELYNDYSLDKNLRGLFNGELQTNNPINMRRVQFGNTAPDYSNSYIILTSKFNETVVPEQTVIPTPSNSSSHIYRNSVGGYGLFTNGNYEITYGLNNLTMTQGTIDFFLQPDWYGTDEGDQTIFTVKDQLDRPIFMFYKNNSNLILKYYSDANTYNIATVNLNSTLLLAKNIYHIRVAWNSAPQINYVYIYVNGKERGRQTFSGSTLIPTVITIGKIETESKGFTIEDLIVYNHSFEYNNVTPSGAYITNDFWDNLSKDVMYGNALIYPSFNGKMKNFSDNYNIQDNTIEHLVLNSVLTFDITAPIGDVVNSPIVYDTDGIEVIGTWTNLGTRIATFTSATVMNEVIVQYSLGIPGGNGGRDVPIEILAAGKLSNIIEEISFNKANAQPREINFLQPRITNGFTDRAWDYSITREQNECFARLLHYYVNGNGTNEFNIPTNLYGYEVIGIMDVTNQKILNITRDISNNNFFVELTDSPLFGETLEFKLALGGMTFDYEIYSKNLVHDIHKTVLLEVVGNGTTYEYIIPIPTAGGVNGGILKSVFTFTDNIFDINGDWSYSTDYNVAYVNDTIYNKIVIGGQSNYLLNSFTIDSDSFGSPFLRITFLHKPKNGDIIQIPVLVSYQPAETEVLSLWYNYIPYQGMLNSTPQNFKRLSQWKYFMTTYGSGSEQFINDTNVYSFNNIINRLPGGSSYAYEIGGENIILEYLTNTLNNTNVNSKLVFVNDVFFNNDTLSPNLFFNLDTDLIISKVAKDYQDGKIIIQGKEFDIFMPNTGIAVNKYLGMTSLVMNEQGEIMLLIIGCLDTELSTTNKLIPVYGDIFRIKDVPTTIANF